MATEKALASVGALTRAADKAEFSTSRPSSTLSLSQATMIWKNLAAIFGEENGLEIKVTVTPKA